MKNKKNYHNVHPFLKKSNASLVRKSAMKTHGSHGPSGPDANKRRKLLTFFRLSSTDLCKTTAKLAMCIATTHLTFLFPYNTCQVIVPDKCPGVRPIRILEVRIRIFGIDRSHQFCIGQKKELNMQFIL